MKKLNLGCGSDYMNGWVNIDNGNVKCDINHDIEVFPWPIENSSVNEIKMQHILEHISKENFISFVREVYRVCSNGAIVNIISPYAGSDNFWTDPTHKMPLTVRTFDYFDKTKPLYENGVAYGWNDVKICVRSAYLKQKAANGPDVVFQLEIQK